MSAPARPAPFAHTPSLAVLRARQWLHFLVLPLAGLDSPAHWPRLLAGVALATLALGYAYGLNAISDRATDLDGRKNPLIGLATCPRSVAALVAGCAVAALALGLLAGLVPLAAVSLSLLASTLYSAGPRWKRLPALGTALNAAIFAPLLFTASTGRLPPSLPLEAATFCALLLQNQLLHEQADLAEDSAARVRTTAHLLGPRGAAALALVLAAGGTLLAFALAPPATAASPLTAGFLTGVPAAALAASLALAAGALIAIAGPRAFAARRLAHRAVAIVGGALVFALARLW